MTEPTIFEVHTPHPTVERWHQWPYYIVALDTNAGKIHLKMEGQILDRLADSIQNRSKH